MTKPDKDDPIYLRSRIMNTHPKIWQQLTDWHIMASCLVLDDLKSMYKLPITREIPDMENIPHEFMRMLKRNQQLRQKEKKRRMQEDPDLIIIPTNAIKIERRKVEQPKWDVLVSSKPTPAPMWEPSNGSS